MARPEIVDPHVHLWALSHLEYPWLTPPFSTAGVVGSVEAIARDYSLSDYDADTAGWTVTGMVHIDAGAHPDDALAETAWLQAMADETGRPQAIVAFAALDSPDIEALLEAQAARPAVRGIRHIANWHADANRTYTPSDLLRSQAWRDGFGSLAQHELSFDLQIYPSQMQAAAELAGEHPDVPVILNHAGMPTDRDRDGLDLWRRGLKQLAQRPNTSVKISGLAMVDHNWSPASLRPFILDTVEAFGPDRVMFASNFPTDKLFGGFSDLFDAYDRATADFTPGERARMFADNARRIYRLPPKETYHDLARRDPEPRA